MLMIARERATAQRRLWLFVSSFFISKYPETASIIFSRLNPFDLNRARLSYSSFAFFSTFSTKSLPPNIRSSPITRIRGASNRLQGRPATHRAQKAAPHQIRPSPFGYSLGDKCGIGLSGGPHRFTKSFQNIPYPASCDQSVPLKRHIRIAGMILMPLNLEQFPHGWDSDEYITPVPANTAPLRIKRICIGSGTRPRIACVVG